MLKYCGIALCALAATIVLRSVKNDMAGLVGIAASVILLGAGVVTLTPIIEFVGEITADSGFGKYMSLMLKALGISLAVQFASEICRDSGESALASKLELIGKAEILLLCIPLIKELMALASEFMSL